jgi:hypothetical protein
MIDLKDHFSAKNLFDGAALPFNDSISLIEDRSTLIQVDFLAPRPPPHGLYAMMDTSRTTALSKILAALGMRDGAKGLDLEARLVDKTTLTRAALPRLQGEYDLLHADGPSTLV